MHRRSSARAWALIGGVTLAALGCTGPAAPARVILCLGDSITYGIVGSSVGAGPMQRDPEGGWPGRLQRQLGPRVRVFNRGLGGGMAAHWLAGAGRPLANDALGLLSGVPWDDYVPVPRPGESLAAVVLRDARPDLVVVLLGVNDLAYEPSSPRVVDDMLVRLAALVEAARAVAPTVLVSTLLPNARDDPALIARANAGIRAAWPDYLPLGERFAQAGWQDLVGDRIHPNAAGQELLASTVADELARRQLVDR